MERIYNKLVRDNIPDIIKENGEMPVIRLLDDISYKSELEKKLYEEYKKENIIHSMGAYANVSDEYVSIVVEGVCDDNDLFIDKIDKDIRKLDVSKEKFEIFKRRLIKNYIVTFDNIEDVEYKITDELTRFGKIDFNDYSIIKNLSYEKCMDVLNKINYDNKCILKTVK